MLSAGRSEQIKTGVISMNWRDQFPAAIRWYNLDYRLRDGQTLQSEDRDFIDGLVKEALSCGTQVPAGFLVYRARFNEDTDTEPHPPERMGMAPADRARESRIAPKGVQCLYAAYESDTALYELRPWPEARLSVVKIKASAPLTVLDLRYTNVEGKSLALQQAAYMLSRPVDPEDDFRYLATQLFAQRLKAAGARGILYRSMLKPDGTNVALFSESDAERISCALYGVSAVDYTFTSM
jgi:hypothetical protein